MARLIVAGVAGHADAIGGFAALAWVAFKLGALSYGGGFVIIPLMEHDAVITYHWMTGAQFLEPSRSDRSLQDRSSRPLPSSGTRPAVYQVGCSPRWRPSRHRSSLSSSADRASAPVNLCETDGLGNHSVVGTSSFGSLIHATVGSAGGSGALRTNRSGCAA